jgi:hypothetical protein
VSTPEEGAAVGPAGTGDRAELRALAEGYASAVDGRDGQGLAELFVEDGTLIVPRYPDELEPTVSRWGHDRLRAIPDGLARYHVTFHEVTGASYRIAGDRAEGQVRCVAHHVTAAPGDAGPGVPAGTDLVWFIRYLDSYVRTADGWRFETRALHLLWTEEHPVAVLGPPAVAG